MYLLNNELNVQDMHFAMLRSASAAEACDASKA